MPLKLGPYRVQKLLGRGGMGAVYAGLHEETGERAAIKSLALTLADDQTFRSRFLVEIETLKQLRHPNIVQMIGDGEQDGNLFFVMELVEGPSLQEALQSGQTFHWRDVIRIAIDICNALKYAHDCGIIHRDLKPANLLQAPDGQIKLTDFGIAKLFGATHRTADGSVVGTADYMAPEQADARPVTNRSDLYSLGAVMFTLLARRTPFAGGSLPQVIHKLKYEEAPSVRRFAPDTPEELDHLIAELLRKDPQQRVATALVLANRLRAMQHALQTRTETAATPDKAKTQVAEPGSLDEIQTNNTAAAPDHPRTDLIPTRGDESSLKQPPSDTWNQATVLTSGEPAVNGSNPLDLEPIAEPEPAPRPNRFTTLEEHRRQQATVDAAAPDRQTVSHTGTIAMAAAVLALFGLCLWGLWPISANSLYGRIQRTAQASSPADAMRDIEAFVQRFPQDAHFAEVEALRMDVESDWLASRLGLRLRRSLGHELEPYEQRWLDAYHLRIKDPAKAEVALEAILAEYGSQPPSESLTKVLAATKHLLARLYQSEPK